MQKSKEAFRSSTLIFTVEASIYHRKVLKILKNREIKISPFMIALGEYMVHTTPLPVPWLIPCAIFWRTRESLESAHYISCSCTVLVLDPTRWIY
jgi:hypothetical protein